MHARNTFNRAVTAQTLSMCAFIFCLLTRLGWNNTNERDTRSDNTSLDANFLQLMLVALPILSLVLAASSLGLSSTVTHSLFRDRSRRANTTLPVVNENVAADENDNADRSTHTAAGSLALIFAGILFAGSCGSAELLTHDSRINRATYTAKILQLLYQIALGTTAVIYFAQGLKATGLSLFHFNQARTTNAPEAQAARVEDDSIILGTVQNN